VTTSEPRIVAVTDSTALVIGLTCLSNAWDVTCQPTTTPAPSVSGDEPDVFVLDLGSTQAGFEELGLPITAADERGSAGTAEDIAPQASARAVIVGDDEPRWPVPADVTVVLRPYTLDQLEEAIGELLSRPEAGSEPVDVVESREPPLPSPPPTPEQELVPTERDERDRTPMTTRLFGSVITPSPPAGKQSETVHAAEEVIDLTQVPTPAEADRPHRWFARRQQRVSAREVALRERLASVLSATSELERLVQQVPMLASVQALGAAIVEDLATRLEADTVGLWRWAEDGWNVLAHHGLTALEATWHVPHDHPMFSEVDAAGGAILIDPVDAAQAAVAGIGGAHTESFMAASIAAGPGRFGILAVGRNRPLTETDLDSLVEVASEAAPGMAVAEQLARLSELAAVPDPEPSLG
jgi:hypothetical protein